MEVRLPWGWAWGEDCSCCGDYAKALSFGAGCGGSFLGVFGYHARSDVEKCNSIGSRTGRCVGDS